MALQEQVVPVEFGGGLDTKTDPRAIPIGKLAALRDAIFTKPKQLRKRNGYTNIAKTIINGGSMGTPRMSKAFNNEWLVADGTSLYSYSPSIAAWSNKGFYESVDIPSVQPATNSGVKIDTAIMGNYMMAVSAGYVTITDTTTNTVIYASTSATSLGGSSHRAVVLGNSVFAVVYLNATTVSVVPYTISGTSVTKGSGVALDTQYYNGTFIALDVVGTSSGAVVAFGQNTGNNNIVTLTLDTTGNIVDTATISNVGSGSLAVSLFNDSATGYTWVYYYISSTTTARFAVYDSSLGTVAAARTISSSITTFLNMASVKVSATSQTLYISYTVNNGTTGLGVPRTSQVTCTTSSVGSVTVFNYGIQVLGKSFVYNSNNYLLVMYNTVTSGTATEATYFVINVSSPNYSVARLYASQAYVPIQGELTSVTLYNSTYVSFGLVYYVNQQTSTGYVNPGLATQGAAITLNFYSDRSYRGVESSELFVLNGASPSMYGGGQVSELGFNLYPEIQTTITAATGGHLGTGTYSYVVIFTYNDAQGNLHFSNTSAPASVTFGSGSTNKVQVAITYPYLTNKNIVGISLYRTVVNGSTYYLDQTSAINVGNGLSDLTILSSTSSDTTISANSQLYTTGGVLQNTAAPASMLLASHNNRLWAADLLNSCAIWYSKTFSPGTGLSMTNLLIQQIDTNGGNIAAIHEMDDKMVCFKSGPLIYWFSGDGATNTGTGITFSQTQVLPTDAGCDQPNSLILMPMGILRHTPKGIYLLARSLQDTYWGYDVESYNSQTFTDATLINDKNQVRFLASSGSSLVYDYVMNQWGTFTNHLGVSADIFQGLYVYARTDGSLYQENTTSFLDNTSSYGIYIQTAPLSFAGVQGFERVRRIILNGSYQNGASSGHSIAVSAAYDFSSTFTSCGSYTLGASASSGSFQFRERLPQQKCDTVSLIFSETTDSGVSGEYVNWTNLSLEVGAKKGVAKLPAAQTIG